MDSARGLTGRRLSRPDAPIARRRRAGQTLPWGTRAALGYQRNGLTRKGPPLGAASACVGASLRISRGGRTPNVATYHLPTRPPSPARGSWAARPQAQLPGVRPYSTT